MTKPITTTAMIDTYMYQTHITCNKPLHKFLQEWRVNSWEGNPFGDDKPTYVIEVLCTESWTSSRFHVFAESAKHLREDVSRLLRDADVIEEIVRIED